MINRLHRVLIGMRRGSRRAKHSSRSRSRRWRVATAQEKDADSADDIAKAAAAWARAKAQWLDIILLARARSILIYDCSIPRENF